jgi:transposase
VAQTAKKSGAKLPDDLGEAHALIAELTRQLERTEREKQSLQFKLEKLARRLFGRSSERGVVIGAQAELPFATCVGEVAADATDETPLEIEIPAHRRTAHRGRRPLPAELPREVVEIQPPAEELECKGCLGEKEAIGADRTETLEYVPASFFIREYVRPKYACRRCGDGVVQAMLPARPIEKGRPEPGLLAHVVSSKFGDHCPHYRQEQIFARHGIAVTRRTLSEWSGAVADLLTPVARAVFAQILDSRWIQSDDTPIDVADQGRQGQHRQGHMWVYRGEHGDVGYDFTWKRNREGPQRILEGYRGYLQADAAPAYDDIFNEQILEVGCWAHARRYFKEAVSSAALEATQVITWVGELYGLERHAKQHKLDEQARQQLREQRARPVLRRIRDYLREQEKVHLPKSPFGQAIGYAQRNWTALERYVEHGALEIDNNGAERAIKPLVLGRKNWLFIGSEAAAHRNAVLLTLVHTAKAHAIDPFVYLRDVIERVSTHPASRIDELTPRRWKALRTTPVA